MPSAIGISPFFPVLMMESPEYPYCRAEYDYPRDRRFHAQPIACPRCGPHLEYWNNRGHIMAAREEALQAAGDAVRQGRIVALKGLVNMVQQDKEVIRIDPAMLRRRGEKIVRVFHHRTGRCGSGAA